MENNNSNDMTKEYIELVDMLKHRLDNKYEVGEAEIVEAMVNYPNILGWAIQLLKDTSIVYDNALLDYNIWYKQRYAIFRASLEQGKGKSYKIGKDDVEACIIADNSDLYKKQKVNLIELKSSYDTARRVFRSVEKIDNVLSNIAYQIRAEMKSFSVEKRTEYRLKKLAESKKEQISTRKKVVNT